MSTTTDAILAAGPTAVALATIGATIWQQRRGFQHERVLVDLDATRALLDDAAVALHDADKARYDMEGQLGPGFREARRSVERLTERLAVRLGPEHEAVKHCRQANDSLLALQRRIGAPELVDFQELAAIHAAFNEARDRFLAAAAKTAGVQLP